MNKIYKVVWNKARNCYVVASEFAKNHQTGSSRIKAASVAAVMAATMLTIGTGVIYAAKVDVKDRVVKEIGEKQTIVFHSTEIGTTKLNDPDLKHDNPDYEGNGHTDKCGELTYNTTLTIGDINKVVDKLVDNDKLLYYQDIKNVTMKDGTISLMRNDGSSVQNNITLTGNGGVNGQDTAVTVTVGNESQKFKTGSVVTAEKDANGNATKLTINGNSYGIKAGEHTTLSNGKNTTVKPVTTADGHLEYKVDVNDELKDIKSIIGAGEGAGSISFANDGIKFNNKVTIDNTGKISGVANGIADNDAVNVSQLNKVSAAAKTEVVKGTNIASVVASNATDDGHTVYTVNAKGTSVSVDGNFNLNTTTDDETNVTNYGISLKDSVAIGGTHAVTINGTDGTVTGLTNTTWNKDSITSGRAATEDQLQAVATEAGKHTTLSNGKNTTVKPVTTADGHLEYKVDVNDELKDIKSIIGAGEGAGSISFANDGIKFNNKVTIDNTGKISGVANGIADNDAVNVSQLNKVSAAAKTEVVKGTNIASVVASNATDDGHTVYTVNAKGTSVSVDGNFNLNTTTDDETNVTNYGISLKDSVAIGGTHAVTINGTDGTVTGLTNTTWNKDSITSGRAATEDQLQAVATEAGKHTTLSNGKNTTVESTVKDGQTDYKVNVAGDLTDITSVANGDSKINLNKDSIIISNGNKYFAITNSGIGMSYIGADYSAKSIMLGENGTTISGGLNVAGSKITGVAAGVEKTDAVNVGQLTDYVAANDTHIKSGNYAVGEVTDSTGNKSQGVSMDIVNKEGKVTGTVTITDVAKASDVGDVNNIDNDIKNQDGSHTTVVHAVNNLNNKLDTKVGDLQYSKVEKGDIADGDSTTTAIGKLDQKLTDVAATAAKHTKVEGSSNIIVTNTAKEGEAANYKVELNKDINVDTVKATTVTTGQTVMNNDGVKVGKDVSVSATAVTAGQTSISNDGLKVNGKTYVSDSGLNANDQKITNVADGKVEKGSTDAVNGGQLYNETRVAKDGNFVKKSNTAGENLSALDNQVTANTESIYHMNGRISDLDNRVNKVGAGAAALAALHPLDFDPDAKWDFAAGYGNYRGANAAAVGAYYRPNEDTMFSVGGTFGNGENMVNAGVSFKLGSGSSHVSTSRVAMAKEIKELRGELEAMKSAMLDANAGKKIDTSKLQLFPDVPQNHWAYEYVAQLAGNGMIEGYPDGNFAGDRPMTRYEFAAILYRAMTKGAVLSDKILSEFSHELEYFTVDTIAKDKAGNPTIQRVRTVKENKNK
ncbi:ESPR-type extended signal peptide-containing protein [Megasphaera elsdenii]|uniref:ESPR-type extended signal peptide-containing protein n=1 Tax=Megasphaera elsdenii TaxID=907 RepID=UPI00266F452E|nr:ESPR-type extended signal peptide-containing protein [Megasphaera elsdenii]